VKKCYDYQYPTIDQRVQLLKNPSTVLINYLTNVITLVTSKKHTARRVNYTFCLYKEINPR